jgi:hypothetical protein
MYFVPYNFNVKINVTLQDIIIQENALLSFSYTFTLVNVVFVLYLPLQGKV